ncbi:MAG: hypothetical protein GC179_26385 [Anaerolineaceae bacterium]|nr:hypothetical protein [Anaerolineaceae bacterium]
MSDNPSKKDDRNADGKARGGWYTPQQTTTIEPVVEAPSRTQTGSGWRVPTLPQNLPAQPQNQGDWHLPRPEDTVFTEESETEITPERKQVIEARPEDFLESLQLGSDSQPSTPTEAAPIAEPTTDKTDSQSLLDLELSGVIKDTGADEDDDEDAFSMSELIALSSLVEKSPQSTIVPKAPSETGTQPAEVTGPQPAPTTETQDPADYARRQLEALQGGSTGAAPVPAVSTAPSSTTATTSPEDYAKQQLAALGATSAEPAAPAAPAAPALTARQQELAQKFRDTETQVRALRAQYQAGQLTRDQLQEQLKRLMILDENNTWWMMGVETDTWYRFQNNEWVVASPPYAPETPSTGGRTPAPTLTSELDPSQVIQGSLPYFPTGAAAPQAGGQTQPYETNQTGGFGITEELGLPRQNIPIQDPERTVVSTSGAYLSPVQSNSAPTVPNLSPYNPAAAETQVNPAYDPYGYGPATPAPIQGQAETAPDYALEEPGPTFEDAAKRQQQRTIRTVLTVTALGIGALLLLVACGVGFVLVQYNGLASQYQAQIAALRNYKPAFQTARVLDINGNLIAELNSQEGGARTTVPLGKISEEMIHAVVSLENERFFEDPGWDWVAIGRAMIQNISAGQIESGASTITQQIAEQLILKTPTNTPALKLQELVIAAEISKQYTKEEILQLYLNEIYFGNQSYGVEAASQFYFNTSADNLNLPQAAMLAGMIASPVQYNPVRLSGDTDQSYKQRRAATFARMDYVIQRMQTVGCLPVRGSTPFCVDANVVRQSIVQKAQINAATFAPREVKFKYPHFVQFVTQYVETVYGSGEMYRRGFVIKTTLNSAIQDAAETALKQTMTTLINTGVNTGSVMVTDPRTGAIKAMVGSPNFNDTTIDGQVNGALTWQQPGSSIKPVEYAKALEGVDDNGDGRPDRWYTPATILWDVPTTFQNPSYTPTNFDNRYHGPVALRYALQNSYNVPAVKTYQFVGDAGFKDMAARLGLSFPDGAQFGLPTAIGATEVTLYGMMSAYGTLVNSGVRLPLYMVDSITDSAGNEVELPTRAQPAQVIQPQIAYLMENILSDDTARATAFGVNGPLTISGIPTSGYVAAKTGTTNDARDLWTMGGTTNTVVGVWLGRPDNNPTAVRDGGYGSAAPLWNRVMTAALQVQGRPNAFPNPPGLIQAQICSDTGTLPPQTCSSLRTELFVQGQEPPSADQAFVQTVAVDTWTGLRANEFCPDNRVTATVLNITDPTAVAWLNSPQGAADAQRLGINTGTVTTVPSDVCSVNTEVPIARILSPTDGQVITNGPIQVVGTASAAQTFNRYQIEYASAVQPTVFTIIGAPSTTPQNSGVLGTWNTQQLPTGAYILRLAMFSNNGGYLYRTINVNIVNVPPTSAPIIQPTSSIPLFVTATPFGGVIDGSAQSSGGFATTAPLPFLPVVTPQSP